MKIAITGATGQLGQQVIQHLISLSNEHDIVALVRHPEKAASFKAQGIEVRHFDYDDIETLEPALEGIDKLLLISGNEIGRRTTQHKAVIDAAKVAGVPYIAYTSLLNAEHSALGLAQEHRETEQLIRESGLSYTFLRNNWYVENYLGSLQHDIASGVIYGASGEGRISAATRSDYAEATARVLLSPVLSNQTYELAASQSFTKAELAAAIAQVANQPVRYENLSADAYQAVLIQAGLPEGLASFLAEVDLKTADGAMFSEIRDLEQLLGRPTTSLSHAIQSLLV